MNINACGCVCGGILVEKYPIPNTDLTAIEKLMRGMSTFTCGNLIDAIKEYARQTMNTRIRDRAMRIADRLIARERKAERIEPCGEVGRRAKWRWVKK